MARGQWQQGGSAGIDTEELTATVDKVLKGYTAGVKGSDEPQEGTLEVHSILSFSTAVYGETKILFKWQNPYAAAGKPFSGVIIKYSLDENHEGVLTQIYKGTGNSMQEGTISQVILEMPNFNTTYYFTCTPYATSNLGELQGEMLRDSITTPILQEKWITYTSSKDLIVPLGYKRADVFLIGGGGGGGQGSAWGYAGNGWNGYLMCRGGGGGFTKTVKNIVIDPGQTYAIIVGAGGSNKANGGASSAFGYSAAGGSGGTSYTSGGNGGSGGGAAAWHDNSLNGFSAGSGGSNGGNGYWSGSASNGSGQGSTTRAWGKSDGTVYSGGGGGGGGNTTFYCGGWGGTGGGGNGQNPGSHLGTTHGGNAASGGMNTGGGGGSGENSFGYGGSGAILLHLY